LRKLFPEIRDVPFDYHWYARGAAAADLLPHLYEPQAGLFAALGFAGRGIAMGTALGRALARRVQGETVKGYRLSCDIGAAAARPVVDRKMTAPAATSCVGLLHPGAADA
jgi:glycine/D-amino acid oxidase-like deaminating enzyme